MKKMKRISVVLLITLMLLQSIGAVFAGDVSVNSNIGNDDKVKTYNSSICYIISTYTNNNGKTLTTLGTGFLISKNCVATSAHVVFQHGTSFAGYPTKITVIPGKNGNDEPYGRIDVNNAASQVSYNPAYIQTTEPDSHGEWDWAVIRLPQDVGNRAGWFHMNWSSSSMKDHDIFAIGHPGGDSWQWKAPGKVLEDNGTHFWHDADVVSGMSGSPLIETINGEWKVRGIARGETPTQNFAVKIDEGLFCSLMNPTLDAPGQLEGVSITEIGGHAFNTNNRDEKTDVHIYINDALGNTVETKITKANLVRDGVGGHGFNTTISWLKYKPGTYKINAYAIYGNNPLLRGCPATYNVRDIDGNIEYCSTTGIKGWVYKPDAPNDAIEAHAYIYNSSGQLKIGIPIKANVYRADLVNAGKGNGYHSFNYDWSKLVNIQSGDTIKVMGVDGSGTHPVIYSGSWNF